MHSLSYTHALVASLNSDGQPPMAASATYPLSDVNRTPSWLVSEQSDSELILAPSQGAAGLKPGSPTSSKPAYSTNMSHAKPKKPQSKIKPPTCICPTQHRLHCLFGEYRSLASAVPGSSLPEPHGCQRPTHAYTILTETSPESRVFLVNSKQCTNFGLVARLQSSPCIYNHALGC